MSKNTIDKDYTERLVDKQFVWWKTILDVQRPYRHNINKLDLGFVLDVGCGIGRNLLHLKGNGVGVDHNKDSVAICKEKGLKAYTNEEFLSSEYNKEKTFDSILLAHVAEHMTEQQATALLKEYLPFLKDNGKVVVITPQEAGYASDQTHVQFTDFEVVKRIFSEIGVVEKKFYSFPFPRFVGKFFKYNEFISVAQKN